MSVRVCRLRSAMLPALLLAPFLALGPCCPPAEALGASGECAALFELYRGCHARGAQADGSLACLEDSLEVRARALAKMTRKNLQAAQVLVELVCGTGCEDAVSRRAPATRQEFTQAFCD
ncbi:MAG: hypothetical protein KKA55_04910 [Proteobacteria bacterium]|nr:hypothetical protein [Pseudomonadota bacterium]MBU1594858.1 hypothetical protein [Pseudomonadota bacterium]